VHEIYLIFANFLFFALWLLPDSMLYGSTTSTGTAVSKEQILLYRIKAGNNLYIRCEGGNSAHVPLTANKDEAGQFAVISGPGYDEVSLRCNNSYLSLGEDLKVVFRTFFEKETSAFRLINGGGNSWGLQSRRTGIKNKNGTARLYIQANKDKNIVQLIDNFDSWEKFVFEPLEERPFYFGRSVILMNKGKYLSNFSTLGNFMRSEREDAVPIEISKNAGNKEMLLQEPKNAPLTVEGREEFDLKVIGPMRFTLQIENSQYLSVNENSNKLGLENKVGESEIFIADFSVTPHSLTASSSRFILDPGNHFKAFLAQKIDLKFRQHKDYRGGVMMRNFYIVPYLHHYTGDRLGLFVTDIPKGIFVLPPEIRADLSFFPLAQVDVYFFPQVAHEFDEGPLLLRPHYWVAPELPAEFEGDYFKKDIFMGIYANEKFHQQGVMPLNTISSHLVHIHDNKMSPNNSRVVRNIGDLAPNDRWIWTLVVDESATKAVVTLHWLLDLMAVSDVMPWLQSDGEKSLSDFIKRYNDSSLDQGIGKVLKAGFIMEP
jgi:hypothetical protein